jgi:hypothetical protein
MPTLQEDFEAFKATRRESAAFGTQQAFERFKQEQLAGGAIRAAPVEPNLPVGAVVGGVAGALTPVPGGAALGTLAGEATQQVVEQAIRSEAAPKTGLEAAQRLLQETLFGEIGQRVGQGGGWLMQRMGIPFAKGLTAEGKEATKFVAGKTSEPIFLPSELTDTRILDVLQNVSEYSLLGGGAIKTFKQNRDLFFQGLADDIINRHGPRMSDVDAGRAVVDAAKRNLEVSTFPAKMIYQAIEADAAPDLVMVPTRMTVQRITGKEAEAAAEPGVKTMTQEIQVGERLEGLKVMVRQEERLVGGPRINLGAINEDLATMRKVAQEAGGLSDREMGNTLLSFLNEKPDIVSYPVAKAIRTEVRTLQRTLEQSIESKNAPAIGKAKTIYAKLTEEIRKGLNDYDPFVAEMWDTANTIEREGQQKFNNSLIRRLVKLADEQGKGKPEAIVEAVWRPRNTTVIQRVRAAVDPTDWGKMQSVEMQNLMAKSLDANGNMSGRQLEKLLFKPGGLGEDAVEAGFDAGTVTELKQFVNALKVAQDRSTEGTGRVLIQLKQGGLAVALGAGAFVADDYTAELLGSAGIVLLGPAALGKVMTSPMGIKWLTEGLAISNKTKTASALAGRILQAAFPRPVAMTAPTTAEMVPAFQSPAPARAPALQLEQ